MAGAGAGDDRWSTLLPDLLVQILTRVSYAVDRVRFATVCTRWRSVLMESRHLLPPTAPLLLLPYTPDSFPRHVYGIPISWVHWLLIPYSQKETNTALQRCRHRQPKKVVAGSSLGWLLIVDSGDVHLWNPVTGAQIPLPSPPVQDCRCFFCRHKTSMRKVVLSSDPSFSPEDCVVMVIRNCHKLIFCRIGDESWTAFPAGTFDDVVRYRGQFYAVTNGGIVVLCDVGPNPKLTPVDAPPAPAARPRAERGALFSFMMYLVVSSGELLMVCRTTEFFAKDVNLTSDFALHKLDVGAKTWIEVVDLGEEALFLGASSSASFAARKVHWGCRRNCIYFLDDRGCSNNGVFDLDDRGCSSNYRHIFDRYIGVHSGRQVLFIILLSTVLDQPGPMVAARRLLTFF